MNRVCISKDQKNTVIRVASDFPIRCHLINERSPTDCVCELMPDGGKLLFGVEHVQEMLGDKLIGPINEDRIPPTTTPNEAPYERWREKDSFGLAGRNARRRIRRTAMRTRNGCVSRPLTVRR